MILITIMKTHRETRQRQAILEILRGTTAHPTAEFVYEKVKRSLPSISKGTVYRNLKVLKEMGVIAELKLDDSMSHYDYRCEPHPHFRCEACDRVLDIDGTFDADLDRRVAASTGLQIHCHELEFRGLCRDCQNTSK